MLVLLASLAFAVAPTGPTCQGDLPAGMDAPRPEMSGTVQTQDVDELFRLHFTDEGEDSVQPELVAWAAEEWTSLRAALAEDPWKPLVGDDGTGGSSAIDGYFVAIEANGYANAITPAEGEDGHSCFIRLDPDIHRLGEVVAKSIVRHELAHCVQFRYTADAQSWMYESGATFEQYRPAPDESSLRLLTNALWAERITQPERPLDDLGEGLVQFEYAGFIWFKHLEESGHPPWEVWEALEAEPAWRQGLNTLLDGDLAGELLRHAWANQHACGRAEPFSAYEVDQAGCTAPVEAPRELADGDALVVEGLQGWTTITFEVPRPPGDQPLQIRARCEASEGGLAVGVDDGAGTFVTSASDEATGAGAVAPGGSALVVVGAYAVGNSAGRCEVDWLPAAVEEEPSGGCSTTHAWPIAWWAPLGLLLLAKRRRR